MSTNEPITDQTDALSDEQWIAIIDEWRESGLSMKEWCRLHEDISYGQFYHQKRRLFPDDFRPNTFMNEETGWSTLSVELPMTTLDVVVNECRVVVHPGFDKELLSEVVEVLKRAPQS